VLFTTAVLDYKFDNYNLIKPMGTRCQTAMNFKFFSRVLYAYLDA